MHWSDVRGFVATHWSAMLVTDGAMSGETDTLTFTAVSVVQTAGAALECRAYQPTPPMPASTTRASSTRLARPRRAGGAVDDNLRRHVSSQGQISASLKGSHRAAKGQKCPNAYGDVSVTVGRQ